MNLKPQHLGRYKDILMLLYRYGNEDVVASSEIAQVAGKVGLEPDALNADGTEEEPSMPERLALDLERLGPTFVKLGQLLSTRGDLISEPYRLALGRLQDNVEGFDYAEVERIVEAELGVRISKAFQTFERKPLASASLGQVHLAKLLDGREVAVKVQRPAVGQEVHDELEALREIASFLEDHLKVARRYRVKEIVKSFATSLLSELDYQREAANLARIGKNLERFEDLYLPRSIDDYTSRRVLTMEYVSGTSIDEISNVVLSELDGSRLADSLFEAYLSQILVDGVFHADPHPGNLLLTRDHRICLLDLGMVGYVPAALQESILRLLLALADGDGDGAADVVVRASELAEDADVAGFKAALSQQVLRQQGAALDDLQVGRVIIDLSRLAADHGVLVPSNLNLIAKALLNLDLIGETLSPGFDPLEAVRRHAGDILSRRLEDKASFQSLFRSAMEAKDLAQALPSRLNTILGNIADNKMELQVKAIDEDRVLNGFQRMANRLTTGVVLAALIVGAALLMRIDTPNFLVFGYPGLAILLFLAAAVCGFSLVISIWRSERRL